MLMNMNQENKNRQEAITEARRAREERQNLKKQQNAAIVIQVFSLIGKCTIDNNVGYIV